MKNLISISITVFCILSTCSFTSKQANVSVTASTRQVYGTFQDPRDKHVYKTVQIGSQVWLAENLKFKTPTGNFAYDLNESKVAVYGLLYNWQTALQACPKGWHLPTVEEWKQLSDALGGEQQAGTQLKAPLGWEADNGEGQNSSGFSAVGAGYRHSDGTFGSLGANCNFWSATPAEENFVWGYNLNYGSNLLSIRKYSVTNYYSVRCVKDSN